jgi:preprotein translocase subunit SecB
MAESSTNGGGLANPIPQQAQPQLLVLGQYTKDLSFENPNAPRSLQQAAQPQISVTVNVNATPLSETDVEVALKLEGKAESAGTLLFNVELVFGGVFRLQNVPQENVHPMLMIECPRLLFPFAREIIANAVRNGGFPPLLLDPIDFVALYQQRAAQEQQAPPAPPNIRW